MKEPGSRNPGSRQFSADSTFEDHYSISDLARLWRLGRETIRSLVKDDPEVVKVGRGRRKAHFHYSVPASAARRIHTKLFNPAG